LIGNYRHLTCDQSEVCLCFVAVKCRRAIGQWLSSAVSRQLFVDQSGLFWSSARQSVWL